MITNKSDYLFVDFPDYNIKINGEIMPKRSGEAKKELRGLDIAFLHEGAMERSVAPELLSEWEIQIQIQKLHLTNEIKAGRFRNVIQILGLTSTIPRPANPYIKGDIPTNIRPVTNTRNDLIGELNLGFASTDFQSNSNDFYNGRPLAVAPIEKIFGDMKKLKTFLKSAVCDYSSRLAIDKVSGNIEVSDWKRTEIPSGTFSIYRSRAYKVERWVPEQEEPIIEDENCVYQVKSGEVKFTCDQDFFSLVDPSKVSMFVTGHATYRTSATSETKSTNYFSPIVSSANAGNKTITIAYSALNSLSSQLISHFGMYTGLADKPEDGIIEINIEIHTFWIKGTLSDRTYWE